MTSFVHDGTEVKLTGRKAVRKIKTAPGKEREMSIVEITPVDELYDWKKWVPMDQLFEVID